MNFLLRPCSRPRLLGILLWISVPVAWADGKAAWLIEDKQGRPIADAVVVVRGDPASYPPAQDSVAIMDQVGRQFSPHVLAIRMNTRVSFPNSDDIFHHVYSFSTPKPFEIELYQGEASQPVLFDKPGDVVLGCNIHDQMLGYIYIVDTPWFAVSGQDGKAQIAGLNAGRYQVQVWHPRAGETVDVGEWLFPEAESQTEPQRVIVPLVKPSPEQEKPGSNLFRPRGFMPR